MLERLATGELRSVNAQVEYLLRESPTRRGIVPDGRGGVRRKPAR